MPNDLHDDDNVHMEQIMVLQERGIDHEVNPRVEMKDLHARKAQNVKQISENKFNL